MSIDKQRKLETVRHLATHSELSEPGGSSDLFRTGRRAAHQSSFLAGILWGISLQN